MTRFPLYHHIKILGHFERVQLVFGKVLSLLWPILYAIRQIIIVEMEKYLKVT